MLALLALLIFSHLTAADGILELFTDEFHSTLYESPQRYETVSQYLNKDLGLTPLLLEPFIAFINATESGADFLATKTLQENLRAAEYAARMEKNGWLDSLILSIEGSDELDGSLIRRTIKSLKKHHVPLRTMSTAAPNDLDSLITDRARYLAMKYISGDSHLQYSTDHDYTSMLADAYAIQREYFRSRLVHAQTHTLRSEKELVEELLHYWYVFGADDMDPSRGFEEAREIILGYVKAYHSISYERRVTANLSTVPFNKTFKMDNVIEIPNVKQKIVFDPLLTANQFSLNIGMKIPFATERFGFSYLSLRFISNTSQGNIDMDIFRDNLDYETGFTHNYEAENAFRYTENVNFTRYNFDILKMQSSYLILSTPVYYANSVLRMEAGIMLGRNLMEYDSEYTLQYSVIEHYPVIGGYASRGVGSGTVTDDSNRTSEQFAFTPLITTTIFPFKMVNLQANWSYNYFDLGLNLNLSSL